MIEANYNYMSVDEEWSNYIQSNDLDNNLGVKADTVEKIHVVPVVPVPGEIHISTKTKIMYLS